MFTNFVSAISHGQGNKGHIQFILYLPYFCKLLQNNTNIYTIFILQYRGLIADCAIFSIQPLAIVKVYLYDVVHNQG